MESGFSEEMVQSSFKGEEGRRNPNLFTMSNPARFTEEGENLKPQSFTLRLWIQFCLNWKHYLFPPSHSKYTQELTLHCQSVVLLTFSAISSDNFPFIKKELRRKGTC